ncbi:MAG: hypothetical protein ACRCZ0_00655 [Cetobacterium sp.]
MKTLTLKDLDSVRNREDRTVLSLHTLYPERFLAEDVAYPDEVKHLTLDLAFWNSTSHPSSEEDEFSIWYRKFSTNTLCSGLTKFHNLETLITTDLNLSSDLWIEFAQNSKKLKELHILTSHKDYEDVNLHDKEEAFTAVLAISTLERVCIGEIYLPYFPPGPSNIKHLELYLMSTNEEEGELERQIESYSKNFSTHINIESLILHNYSQEPGLNVETLKLEKLPKLKKLKLICSDDKLEKMRALLPHIKIK